MASLMSGIMMFMIYGFNAYSYWIGTVMVHDKRINVINGKVYDAGSLLIILTGMLNGMITLMSLTPNI
jgi:hypothetical protein